MEEASVAQPIDRKLSIETEPRTLNIDQMQDAREAALYVLRTRDLEEAMRIFTEGLEPVTTGVWQGGDMRMDLGEEEEEYFDEQVKLPAFRHVASAPF